ncbi:MAG: TadE family protein [Dehalococcoidia bacterium]
MTGRAPPRTNLRTLLRGERGSSLVEAALVLPVVVALAMGVVMAGRVVQAKIGVQAAAREAARAMAVAPSPWEGSSAAWTYGQSAALAHGLSPARFSLYVDNGGFARGGTVRAAAWYWIQLADLPFLGRYQLMVSSTHIERIELYRARSGGPP